MDLHTAWIRFSNAGQRRWLHDDHVDSLAAMLQPLGTDWFHRPTVGYLRG
ncbi:MAG: hypothetical protein ACKO9B_16345 [Planctomycetota bacterium]